MGGEALAVGLDVTDDHSVAYCLAMAVEALGDIEVLVAGAGETTFGLLADIDSAIFDDQLQVHLVGANRLATAVLPGMVRRQRGQLIFVGSDVALRRRPHMGAYGAAKVALTAMVESLQMELEGSGVSASIVTQGRLERPWDQPCLKTRWNPSFGIGLCGATPVITTPCAPRMWHARSRS